MFLLDTLVTTDTNGSISQSAAAVGHDVMNYLTSINWASPSWDLVIVLFFVVTVFLYGMSLGRDRIIVILMSIYMALAVISNAPLANLGNGTVSVGSWFAFRVTAFLGLFVLLFFLLSRSALMKTFGNLASGSWWQVFLFSVFHVGLLVSITLSFLPPEAANHLAPLTRHVFASQMGKFLWIVAPILAMAVIKGE